MTTGIPVELLFTIIGALLLCIYADLKFEVRRLRKESVARGLTLALLRQALHIVCTHLKIPFSIGLGPDKDDIS